MTISVNIDQDRLRGFSGLLDTSAFDDFSLQYEDELTGILPALAGNVNVGTTSSREISFSAGAYAFTLTGSGFGATPSSSGSGIGSLEGTLDKISITHSGTEILSMRATRSGYEIASGTTSIELTTNLPRDLSDLLDVFIAASLLLSPDDASAGQLSAAGYVISRYYVSGIQLIEDDETLVDLSIGSREITLTAADIWIKATGAFPLNLADFAQLVSSPTALETLNITMLEIGNEGESEPFVTATATRVGELAALLNGDVAIIDTLTVGDVTLTNVPIDTDVLIDIVNDPSEQDGTLTLQDGARFAAGLDGNDTLTGFQEADLLLGLSGQDSLRGDGGNDTLHGGDGSDTLLGGDGDDFIFGGDTTADLRDVVYAGNGDDSVEGGYGNDELRGDAGNDTLSGGFGSDTVIGGTGEDVLTGSAWGDVLFGGDGDDFINGGFGFDRVNGGAGADRFFHLGVADHGSDWIQDYDAADGDVLVFGGGAATADDFLVQRANTPNAGNANVDEVFITHIATGTLLWALVDGDAQTEIHLRAGGETFDLLA